MIVFTIVFIILTLLHPIGDFMCSKRRFKGEFLLVLNPLHWLWDSSRFRRHHKFMKRNYAGGLIIENSNAFFFWLGFDQLAHVILNIITAYICEVVINA